MKKSRLFSRDFTIMIIGQIISLFGNSILRFALSLYVLDLTGNAAVFGGILAISMIPTVLLSPFGGMLADRLPKQKIMWFLDFSTAGLIVVFAALMGLQLGVSLIAVTMTLLSIIQAFYQPSVVSSVPSLVEEDQLMAANGIVVQVQALSSLLGPIIGGILYGFLVEQYGLFPILVVSAACFFLSAVMELFLHIPFIPQKRQGSILRQVKGDLGEALHFLIKDNRSIAKLLIIIAGLNLFLSALFVVGLPYLIKIHLGLSAQMYGFAEAAMGLGSIIGGLSSGFLAKKFSLKQSYMYLLFSSAALLPMALSLLFNSPGLISYGLISLGVLLGMAGASVFNIACQTYLQQSTPTNLLGKVGSFVTVIAICALPLGQAMYGLLFQALAAFPWIPVLMGVIISMILCLATKKALSRVVQADAQRQ